MLLTGIVYICKYDKFKLVKCHPLAGAVKINSIMHKILNDDSTLEIAFDQSTNCTGICIMDTHGSVKIHLDYIRFDTPVDIYIEKIDTLVDLLTKGFKCSSVVMEKPLFIKSKSTKILQHLGKVVRHLPERIESMYGLKTVEILPNVWKSYIRDKSKGKYRSNVKKFMASDICDILPYLENYYKVCTAVDYDSFDATGILLCYQMKHKIIDGEQVNSGSVNYDKPIYVIAQYLDKESAYNQNVINCILPSKEHPKRFQYNSKYTLNDNCKMCCSENVIGCFIINDEDVKLNFAYIIGRFPSSEEALVVLAVRENYLNKSDLIDIQSVAYSYMCE